MPLERPDIGVNGHQMTPSKNGHESPAPGDHGISDPEAREPKPQQEQWFGHMMARALGTGPSGWPRIAAFVDSDSTFRIYRRFGFLRTRLLLYHQDILAEMEAKLDWLDRDDARSPETQRYLSSRREDDLRQGSPRRALFQDIESQLEIYDSLLKRSAQIYQLEEAPTKHRQAVVNHIWSDGTIKERDREYILHADDLVYLNADTEASWVHWFVGYLLYHTGPILMVNIPWNVMTTAKLTEWLLTE
ncbi:hypothetical protein CLCR_07483 [Cladophialophora carrionii]|uniref:DUF6594 domain-containing protein n=1 Tax=Cladophialophora carrionii TaxID=86049 RepID=A0A1C1CMC5_9EURO|nr:hypothetical protein CLCR_07483 [Cladophialophora carrionii]